MKYILGLLVVLAFANVIPFVEANENDEMTAYQRQLNKQVMDQNFTLNQAPTVESKNNDSYASHPNCESLRAYSEKNYQACVLLHALGNARHPHHH